MILELPKNILDRINDNGEAAYPDEGAGLLLGVVNPGSKQVAEILVLTNSREQAARHNRFLITAEDMMFGEQQAERLGLEVIGVFHSHPDHPNQPSEYDREWALPWYSYVITSINAGAAGGSRSWQLSEDRASFYEETIRIYD